MKKFEGNGFTATVTEDNIRWELPISNLINAFRYSPENYDEFTVKRGKRKEFAEFVAQKMFDEADQDTGASYIEEALDKVFSEMFQTMRINL